MNPAIEGLWPALLLPLKASGQLDTERTLAHARHLLAAGCDGVTLFGTTGEGPAFTVAERQTLLESMLAGGIAADRLVVTTTAVALDDAIEVGRHASQLGVHRQLWMPPFYYKQPRDAGVVEAASRVIQGIADADLRLLLYHFPAMSSYGFSHAAIAELVRRHPDQVVGVKDSSGDLDHACALARAFPQLSILVGAELHVAAVMRVGGRGSINGLANIAPRLMRRVIDHPESVSDADHALIASLLALLSVRPGMNFVSVYKTMLAQQTGDDAWLAVRAPLSPLDNTESESVRQGYRAIGTMLAHV